MTKKGTYLILDNLRSRENVGSIFRTSDGAGVEKIFLCGITPTPPHPKITKSALGADQNVPWEYHKQTWRLVKKLKSKGSVLLALERFDRLTASKLGVKSIFKFKPKFPLALIVGNEVRGLNKKILSLADKIIEIPMHGKKESLNVAVATGIALYQIKK